MEPLHVEPPHGRPRLLHWRGARYQVLRVLGWWSYRGRWWTDAQLQGERRLYCRVLCRQGPRQGEVVMEIFRHDGGWTLSRLAD